VDRDGGNAGFFQLHGEPDDRRATGASQTDTEDGGVAVFGDLRPHPRIVDPAFARLDDGCLDARQVLTEPVAQLKDEGLGIVEQTIDEIDVLAAQAFQARRERLPVTFGGVAPWIVNCQFSQSCTPPHHLPSVR